MVIDDRQDEYDAGSRVQQLGASSTQEKIRKSYPRSSRRVMCGGSESYEALLSFADAK
ncbi:hypothetical protein E4U61_006349 [Claviceps capensis]|nr:hypothetical protein E4U61_006349 [Claviceps capensis]